MKPTEIGNCKLYQGDCMEIMDHLDSMDALVTDPPYGIGESKGKNKSRSVLAKAQDYGVDSWDDQINQEAIDKAISLTKHQIIYGGNYYNLSPTSCFLVWDKDNGESDFADCELAWTNLKKAVRRIKWRWAGMLQQNMKDKEERVHPTQKPIEVMKWSINHLPDTTQIVFDPFMGSGTTGVAAVKLGLSFIGIEKEVKYFDIACKRIEEAFIQPDMFVELNKTEKQGALI